MASTSENDKDRLTPLVFIGTALTRQTTLTMKEPVPCRVEKAFFPFYLSSIAFEGNIVQQHVGQDPLKALKCYLVQLPRPFALFLYLSIGFSSFHLYLPVCQTGATLPIPDVVMSLQSGNLKTYDAIIL
ncbi:hypothetical protein F2P81_014318 [Scophthalmus maximus]|uniref:Uncharacterized protein n=1 Tax=Scophthalmus maximus TaxID=52904 RepID=A0A6A4SVZ2_SCOMX|nr:hypothetical protein F2P81_014318 [Scophthalmus maximus]